MFPAMQSWASEVNSSVHLLVGGGLQSILERNQDQNYIDRRARSYFIGTGYRDFTFILEDNLFTEQTGQGALIVDRSVENTMLWGLWTPDLNWSSFLPFLSAGIGQSVETIDTTLLATITRDRGRAQVIGGGAFGVRSNMPYVWFSLEVRLLAAERWDPNPTVGLLGRLGLYF